MKDVKITDVLLGEHGVFCAQFEHLENAIPECQSLGLVQAQGAMLTAALETHACMEDHLLFANLEPYPSLASHPLPVMRQEHEWIKGMLARVQEVRELDEAKDSLLGAVRVARQHFSKEEQILFPAAEQVLEAERLEELGEMWAQKRQVGMGHGGCSHDRGA
jgi:iron-sulfur cluster repair protein YtfE (RIC family)